MDAPLPIRTSFTRGVESYSIPVVKKGDRWYVKIELDPDTGRRRQTSVDPSSSPARDVGRPQAVELCANSA